MSRSSESRRRPAALMHGGRIRRSSVGKIAALDDLAQAMPLRHGDVVALPSAVLSSARQDRLNAQLGECGCDAGERGVAHGLLIAGCVCLLTGGRLRVAPTMAVGGLCGAGIGKVIGRRGAMAAARQTAAGVIRNAAGSPPAGSGPRRGQGAARQLMADGRR